MIKSIRTIYVKNVFKIIVMRKPGTDDIEGMSFTQGNKVVRGHYFGVQKTHILVQKLINRIPAGSRPVGDLYLFGTSYL